MLGKFSLLFLVWIGLTNTLNIQELIVGAIVSFGIVYYFTENKALDVAKTAMKYIKFTPMFFKSLIKSNIEVAKIVLNPKLPINPGIVKLKTSLTNEYDKLLLANAITLTPGTISIELKDEYIYIHVLDLKTTDHKRLQKEIIETFEKVLL